MLKKSIKHIINKNDTLTSVSDIFLFLKKSIIYPQKGDKRKYPKVIQLPITYKCNSRCVMCNIWKMDWSNESEVNEFSRHMKDPLFKEVVAVGINGGEPSLIRELPNYAREILNLPSLKSLNIISHGFNKKILLSALESIYRDCKAKGVKFHVSISLDGFDEVHDIVRGVSGVFQKTMSSIGEIQKNQHLYCDSFEVGCTIVKQNIYNLTELDVFSKIQRLPIKYRLGIDNKRIESHKLRKQYSVIYSPLKQAGAEFFHWQYHRTKKLTDKFKYFAIYHWLTIEEKKRLMGCLWKDEGVTLDSRGSVFYCAVASEEIGSLRKNSGEEVFFSEKNISYRKEIVENSCNTCIHDYAGKPVFSDVLVFFRFMISQKISMKIYKLRTFTGFL